MSSKPLKTSFSLSFSLQGRLVERVQEASEVQSDRTCLGWARAGGQAPSYLCQTKLKIIKLTEYQTLCNDICPGAKCVDIGAGAPPTVS